jgi:hypothetical protein
MIVKASGASMNCCGGKSFLTKTSAATTHIQVMLMTRPARGARAPASTRSVIRQPGAQSERWNTTLTTVPLGSRSMKRRTPHSSSRRG